MKLKHDGGASLRQVACGVLHSLTLNLIGLIWLKENSLHLKLFEK